ncbi:phenylalanine--tRNA ligase subunit beta [Frischella sp. Ac13]|uniref:Phenylalanine--tRNA ligase beta subunit n=1 Tax=Frischella japonica TaxID=2741544 RepID=A0ABR7QVW2_9GAMM|nr:phenylalanine--tRNA ligase subunit beta [Frischella japonica]MBC9130331.1 phenylalanine--tRNA ligase subunit beta [Frischella japonica]
MKFSESWLREWVNPAISSEQLCDQLTMAGLEVDDVENVAGDFSGVVIGRVVECQQHPNADKLRVTKVDIGQAQLLNIVCGAPNCRQGLMVACATIGAVLPGDFKIKAAKLRGEPSEGMLCSFSELGISDDHSGIIELPDDAPLGEDVRKYLQLNDKMIEISVTPNRSDCFGIMGIARDISSINDVSLTPAKFVEPQVTIADKVNVSVLEPEAAPRYLARVIKNIDATKSTPLWMKDKLRRSGIRSIDIVVDITNYVLIELGHPMHAFDLDKIEGGITVRYAHPQEKLILLDGNEIEIKDNTLVIADDKKTLALAGIFGGKESGVSPESKNVLLEAAFFSPVTIAGKARQYGLHTDASHRYERGVDPSLQHIAMERATELLLSICGGSAGPITDVTDHNALPKPAVITLTRQKIDRLIGCHIAGQRVTDILTRLGCEVIANDDHWQVKGPSWRFDIQIEEDLVEEIARIYGYNNIPNEHLNIELMMHSNPEKNISLNKFKQLLVNQGYQEAVTYSFVDPKIQSLIHPNQMALALPNPISSEMSVMRLSLWTGLLNAVIYNQNRQQQRVRLFETGLQFVPDVNSEFGISQQTLLAGVITGNLYDEHWAMKKRTVDFFDLKGNVESLLALSGLTDQVQFKKSQHPALHPGQSATIYVNDEQVGYLGAIHPEIEKKLGLNSKTLVFEFILDKINKKTVPIAKDVSKYPANRRDIAIIVDSDVCAADVLSVCKNIGGEQLINVNLFDVYQGENIKEGQKSLAISMILQDKARTLEDEDITHIVSNCIVALQDRFKALLRE